MLPFNKLELKSSVTLEEQVCWIGNGTDPISLLWDRSRCEILAFAISDGIGPDNWFDERSKEYKLGSRKSCGGITPDILLCERCKIVRLDKFINCEGIEPLIWLSSM